VLGGPQHTCEFERSRRRAENVHFRKLRFILGRGHAHRLVGEVNVRGHAPETKGAVASLEREEPNNGPYAARNGLRAGIEKGCERPIGLGKG